ncbi:hypothetical protein OsI_03607 [Oryza sativa Indica Group]|uniref:Uncharacterized protein n=1 Tax=Oryza sativa subsp. indica TaxID=39946 RepID=B8A905_ORYSI|nr:hypothetical protein OsI_03607 [Oryza sativa Indica Group]
MLRLRQLLHRCCAPASGLLQATTPSQTLATARSEGGASSGRGSDAATEWERGDETAGSRGWRVVVWERSSPTRRSKPGGGKDGAAAVARRKERGESERRGESARGDVDSAAIEHVTPNRCGRFNWGQLTNDVVNVLNISTGGILAVLMQQLLVSWRS